MIAPYFWSAVAMTRAAADRPSFVRSIERLIRTRAETGYAGGPGTGLRAQKQWLGAALPLRKVRPPIERRRPWLPGVAKFREETSKMQRGGCCAARTILSGLQGCTSELCSAILAEDGTVAQSAQAFVGGRNVTARDAACPMPDRGTVSRHRRGGLFRKGVHRRAKQG